MKVLMQMFTTLLWNSVQICGKQDFLHNLFAKEQNSLELEC